MKIDLITGAAVAFAGFAAVAFMKSQPKLGSAPPQTGGEVQRMAGVDAWFGASYTNQQQNTFAIQDSFVKQQKNFFALQPEFWVLPS